TTRANTLWAATAVAYRSTAHWAAKDNSATVATLRPMMTLDSQVSKRHSRGMSYTGRTERNAHPKTYTPDNRSWIRQTANASAGVNRSRCPRFAAVKDQAATLSAATTHRNIHHEATPVVTGS